MLGIGLVVVLLVWAVVSLWIGSLLGRWLLCAIKLPRNSENLVWTFLLNLVFASLVFVLPIADEIIAYPRLQQLCEGSGKHQFGPGMDERKVLGREVYPLRIEEYIILFPTVHTLTKIELQNRANEQKMSGVVVIKTIDKNIDIKTGELILSIKTVKPISSLFAIPTASGNRATWILNECGFFGFTNGKKNPEFYKSLQLKQVEAPVNNYILKEE